MRFTISPALLLIALIGALIVPSVHAQSNQLEQSQMAVVRFDINLEKIRESEMSQTLNLEEKIKEVAKTGKFDPNNVKRVYGAASVPESIEAAKGYKGEGPLPADFFARIELVDSKAADEAMEGIEKSGEAVEIGGKTYYKSTDERSPEGLLVHQVDGSTIEMGTEAYLLRADRKVNTDGLNAAWEKAPQEAVRIAMDLEGASGLVGELQEMVAKKGPPNFAAYYELIGAISDMHITIDMDGDNLITIGMTGKSESQAEDVEGGLNSLIGMGQMLGMGQVGQLKQVSPDLGGMAEKMLEALKASRAGEDVSIKLIHPEGLAAAIKGMMGG